MNTVNIMKNVNTVNGVKQLIDLFKLSQDES